MNAVPFVTNDRRKRQRKLFKVGLNQPNRALGRRQPRNLPFLRVFELGALAASTESFVVPCVGIVTILPYPVSVPHFRLRSFLGKLNIGAVCQENRFEWSSLAHI